MQSTRRCVHQVGRRFGAAHSGLIAIKRQGALLVPQDSAPCTPMMLYTGMRYRQMQV